jgi:hypothetical protein
MVVDFIDYFAAIRVKVLISIPRCRPLMRPVACEGALENCDEADSPVGS